MTRDFTVKGIKLYVCHKWDFAMLLQWSIMHSSIIPSRGPQTSREINGNLGTSLLEKASLEKPHLVRCMNLNRN